jgi:hypothetical protein
MCPAISPPLPSSSTSLDTKYLKPIPNSKNQTTTVMKTTLYSLLAAAACGMAFGQTAYTTPVGYYNCDAVAGGNIFVPALIITPVFAGSINGSTAMTLTFAGTPLTADAFNKGTTYPTHCVEITSGPNAGVVLDIDSNTTSVITLMSDITDLALVGTESVRVRPHNTIRSVLSGGEPYLDYTDNVTVYEPNGDPKSYLWITGIGWSNDFSTNDGDLRPISLGAGLVLGVFENKSFTVTGEVKTGDTVVQLAATPAVNIVGPVNPLVGSGTRLDQLGFQNLSPYTDATTLYTPGSLSIVDTYLPDGGGSMLDGTFTPSTAQLPHTSGAIVSAFADTAVKFPGVISN